MPSMSQPSGLPVWAGVLMDMNSVVAAGLCTRRGSSNLPAAKR